MASSGRTTAVMGGSGSVATPANNVGGTGVDASSRRMSQEHGGMFSGLVNHKRNSSDQAAAARRQSFNEMKPAPGFIGQMWNNFTKGDSTK